MISSTVAPQGARAIVTAATELFAEAGYDSVSVAEIAARAHVCKANIFHHFDSKEVLYLEVMREACKGHAEFTEGLLSLDIASGEKLRRLIGYDFADMLAHEQRAQLVFREVLNVGTVHGRCLAEQVFQRNLRAVVALFRQGQERGEFRPDLDPAVAAWMLGASVMMFFQNRAFIRHVPEFRHADTPLAWAERVFDTLMNGLVTPAAKLPQRTRLTATRKSRDSSE